MLNYCFTILFWKTTQIDKKQIHELEKALDILKENRFIERNTALKLDINFQRWRLTRPIQLWLVCQRCFTWLHFVWLLVLYCAVLKGWYSAPFISSWHELKWGTTGSWCLYLQVTGNVELVLLKWELSPACLLLSLISDLKPTLLELSYTKIQSD